MHVSVDELIEKVIYDESLTSDEKIFLKNRIRFASYGSDKNINSELFFISDIIDNKIMVAIMCRKYDPSTCRSYRSLLNYDSDTIVDLLKKEWLNKENGKRL